MLGSNTGVHGLDLLAYQATVDVVNLIEAVCKPVEKPVIPARAIDRDELMHAAVQAKAIGYTVCETGFNERFSTMAKGIEEQIRYIKAVKENAERKLIQLYRILIKNNK